MSSLLISDVIDEYTDIRNTDKENDYLQSVVQKIQNILSNGKTPAKLDCIQILFFLNLIGLDTSWAHFYILEVMASNDYSSKCISYLAATLTWNSTSDVSLMATNRITKDLTSGKPLITSLVLSSVPTYLSPTLSQLISNDVIKLMQSSTPVLRQKAITTFYQICLRYPDALKAGFPTLRACLDDPKPAVIIPALFVINELCIINPSNFIALIPKLFKILTSNKQSTYIVIKVVQILTMLSLVEKRLPKKLLPIYSEILDSTSSMSQLYDIVKSIITIPITNSEILNLALQRIEPLITHSDPNIRSMFTKFFMKLILLEPKLLKQHKETVTQCLGSEDETERLLALDLIASLANQKSIVSIVDKMVDNCKTACTMNFRNETIKKIISICSQNDYEFISDFSWYIDILFGIIRDGGFNCFQVIADQLLDLAIRVPSTRNYLVSNLGKSFNQTYMYQESMPLLLAISHIIGTYSNDPKSLNTLLSPFLLQCNERVQQSYIISAFGLFIRLSGNSENCNEQDFREKLEVLKKSNGLNIKSEMATYESLASLLCTEESIKSDLRSVLYKNRNNDEDEELDEDMEPLTPPPDFNDPITLLQDSESIDFTSSQNLGEQKSTKKKRKGKRVIRHQKQNGEEGSQVRVIRKKRNQESTNNDDNKEDATTTEGNDGQNLSPQTETDTKTKRKHTKTKKNHTVSTLSHLFIQNIGQNSFIKISAVDFLPQENHLTIKILIENLNSTPIPSFDVKVFDTNTVKAINVPHVELIEGNQTNEYLMEVEVLKPNLPQLLKVVFTPVCYCSCDSLETHIKIFPSFFLQSAPQSTIEIDKCNNGESITVEASDSSEIDEIISIVSAILKTTEVKMSDDEYMLFSTATFNLANNDGQSEATLSAVGKIDIETDEGEQLLKIEVKSGDKTFTNALLREIEMRIESNN